MMMTITNQHLVTLRQKQNHLLLLKSLKRCITESADTRELTNLLNKRTPLTPAEQKESRVREKTCE